MGIIYAALVMQSTVQMTNVLLSVFMLDGIEFVCHTASNGTFKGVSVVLVSGPGWLVLWPVTKSDMQISNLLLRSLSDVITGF